MSGGGPEAPGAPTVPEPRPRRYRPLVALGFVLAVVAMVLGLLVALAPLVIGAVLATSGRRRAGIAIVATTLVLVLVPRVFVIVVLGGHSYRIPSGAMEPTIDIGDKILTIADDTPERGELYVFHPPAGAVQFGGEPCGVRQAPGTPCAMPTPDADESFNFVKRVVALPGDRLKVVRNRVYVNGAPRREPYIRSSPCAPPTCDLRHEITVPADHYFMLGDNRGESADSREYGPIKRSWLVGRVVLRYWPLGRFGSL